MGLTWTQTNPNDLEQESQHQMPLNAWQVRQFIPMNGAGPYWGHTPEGSCYLAPDDRHPVMQVYDG